MATPEQLEIYKQRYDTYRHLDKLRWQMFQIAIGSGSVVFAFGRGESSQPDWWVLSIIGLLLVTFGLVMERIRYYFTSDAGPLFRSGWRERSRLVAVEIRTATLAPVRKKARFQD